MRLMKSGAIKVEFEEPIKGGGKIKVQIPTSAHKMRGYAQIGVEVDVEFLVHRGISEYEINERVIGPLRNKVNGRLKSLFPYLSSLVAEKYEELVEKFRNWVVEKKLPFTVLVSPVRFYSLYSQPSQGTIYTEFTPEETTFGNFKREKDYLIEFSLSFLFPDEEDPSSIIHSIKYVEYIEGADETFQGTVKESLREIVMEWVESEIISDVNTWLSINLTSHIKEFLKRTGLVSVRYVGCDCSLRNWDFLSEYSPFLSQYTFTLPLEAYKKAKEIFETEGIRALLKFLAAYLGIDQSIISSVYHDEDLLSNFYSHHKQIEDAFERGVLKDEKSSKEETQNTRKSL